MSKEKYANYLVEVIELLNQVSIKRLWYALSWIMFLFSIQLFLTLLMINIWYNLEHKYPSFDIGIVFLIDIAIFITSIVLIIYNYAKARSLEERIKENIHIIRTIILIKESKE